MQVPRLPPAEHGYEPVAHALHAVPAPQLAGQAIGVVLSQLYKGHHPAITSAATNPIPTESINVIMSLVLKCWLFSIEFTSTFVNRLGNDIIDGKTVTQGPPPALKQALTPTHS
jgi:hypothetical protein